MFITVAFYVSMKYQSITPKMLLKIICCRKNYRSDVGTLSPEMITNVLGENIINNTNNESEIYFKQMKDSWDAKYGKMESNNKYYR